ncbi:MAG: nickel pincer cofactor biosynthesis protein LarB [Planctomycetaceae bacterium]|nr:nickel pincer cofactor biosynthesis protein LarB [Planctomycetaceae bacterium]
MLKVPDFQKAAKDFRAGKLDIQQFTRLMYAATDSNGGSSAEVVASPSLGATGNRESGVSAVQDSSANLESPRLNLDLERAGRCGYPEVIFGPGKSLDDLLLAAQRLLSERQDVLITRIGNDEALALAERYPAAIHNRSARTIRIAAVQRTTEQTKSGRVAVLTAGTGDIPIAEEASETLRWMGFGPTMIHDVGVAGPHRLLRHVPYLQKCDVIVVVAGMEGALPSVVGGHVACPVIAVPTSLGYGAHFQGLVPLLGMLNSCAANVIAVNIDSGFKGGFVAGLILNRAHASVSSRQSAD